MPEWVLVRSLGSGKTHVVEGPVDWDRLKWIGPEFEGLIRPIEAVCRTRVRSVVVKMTDAPLKCVPCRRITGMAGVGPHWGPDGSKHNGSGAGT